MTRKSQMSNSTPLENKPDWLVLTDAVKDCILPDRNYEKDKEWQIYAPLVRIIRTSHSLIPNIT
ncbi:MAG: hypothetical protein EOM59_14860 [Clostridia bacterium]|nr:hypothetical protein [Clostridia bacterium]